MTRNYKEKTADTLEIGDVFRWRGRWAVLVEQSDSVDTIPCDGTIILDGLHYRVKDCCEPRIRFLGRTGRKTNDNTYIVVPNARKICVYGFLDLEIDSAVPEMFDGFTITERDRRAGNLR